MKKADCTPEQWEKYKAQSKAWYVANRERVIERTKAYNKSEKAKERRRAYDMKPEVKARRQERERQSEYQKARYQRIKNDPAERAKRAAYHRAMRTGVTPQIYGTLMAAQDGRCAVCQREFGNLRVHADHCHDTGNPRGLLCSACNTIEGHIRRIGISPKMMLNNLHDYLQNPPFKNLA